MQKAADEYYELIVENKENKDPDKIKEVKDRLDELMKPYYDDPAYVLRKRSLL